VREGAVSFAAKHFHQSAWIKTLAQGAPVAWTETPLRLCAGKIAAATGDQAQHIRKLGFDNRYYRDLLLALIREHGPVSPEVINELFMEKLPDVLTDDQKRAKIRNLTFDLAHRRGLIENTGSARGKGARWSLRRPQTNGEKE
jgi:hypothetical protein